MTKKVLAIASLAALGLATIYPVYAGAPAKISSVAPVADLIPEAEAKIKLLEEHLASNEKYVEASESSIPTDAGVLAVLAQAIAESDEDSAWKKSAANLRDGAVKIATAKSYADAKAGLEEVKKAQAGKASGAKPDAEWNKLCKLGLLMKEVGKRNGKMRLASRRIPDDPSEVARSASVMAVLALVIHEDTHEVKKPEDVAEWKEFAKEFQKHITEASAALKKKDGTVKETWTKANTACNNCHDKYRD